MSETHERTRGTFKATAIAITYNNPPISPEDFWDILRASGAKYCVFQLEEGDETGTPHFQGYAHFGDQRRFGPQFRSRFPSAIWIKKARGSAKANRRYCTKEETRKEGPWEHGSVPPGQGHRSDLTAFYEEVREHGKRLRDLAEDHHCIIARYPKYYNTLLSLRMPALRNEAPTVVLSYGITGVGKTRAVMDEFASSDEFFRAPLGGGFWMDGYDGHKYVLMDDFNGASSKVALAFLLQILDRYPVQVPVKGSFTWWYPQEIHITTNVHPWKWYDYGDRIEHYRALLRRFTCIKQDLIPLGPDARKAFEESGPNPPPLPMPEYPNLPPYNMRQAARRAREEAAEIVRYNDEQTRLRYEERQRWAEFQARN